MPGRLPTLFFSRTIATYFDLPMSLEALRLLAYVADHSPKCWCMVELHAPFVLKCVRRESIWRHQARESVALKNTL